MAGSYRPERPCPMRCKECICGIENDRGIWCARFKKIPSPREVKRCRHFCPKAILNNVEVEASEPGIEFKLPRNRVRKPGSRGGGGIP